VGLFNTAHFDEVTHWSLGLEPVVTLTSGAGAGANLRFTYGLTELNNINFIIGAESGSRGFRVGLNYTFDFFPDVSGQPGIGLAVQAIHYRLATGYGQSEFTAIPYFHKTFGTPGAEVEPYLGIPLGLALDGNGSYFWLNQIQVGSLFRASKNFRFVLELGIGTHNTDTYASGGVLYSY
jgi:hypothetical protein